MITDNRDYIGGGRQSGIFTAEEESKLLGFVSQRLRLCCGLDFHQLSQVIHELASSLRSSNPHREFPSTWEELIPPESCENIHPKEQPSVEEDNAFDFGSGCPRAQSEEYKKIFRERIEAEEKKDEKMKATLKRKQERELQFRLQLRLQPLLQQGREAD